MYVCKGKGKGMCVCVFIFVHKVCDLFLGQLCAEGVATPVTHYRPGSALKPHSATGIQLPSTRKERPAFLQTGVGSRPGTSTSSLTGSSGSRFLGVKLG